MCGGRLVGRGVRAPCCQPWRCATLRQRAMLDPCPPTVRAGKGGSPRIRAATRAAESSRRTTSAGSCARARCSPAARCCRARGSSTSTAPFASACSRRGRASSRSSSSSAAIGAQHPLLPAQPFQQRRACRRCQSPSAPPPPHHVRFPAACASQDPRRMLAQGQGDGDCIGCRAHVPALSRRVALHAHVCAQGRIGVMLRRSCTCRRPFWGAGRAGSRSSSHLHIVWSYIRYILYELSVYDWRPVSSPDPYVNAVSSCPGVVRVCSRRRSGY